MTFLMIRRNNYIPRMIIRHVFFLRVITTFTKHVERYITNEVMAIRCCAVHSVCEYRCGGCSSLLMMNPHFLSLTFY